MIMSILSPLAFLAFSVCICKSCSANCASTWPTFDKHLTLNRSAVQSHDKSRRSNSRRRSTDDGVFVHPSSKFAFCLIQKNGCSAWTKVFNMLVNGKDDKNYGLAKKVFSKRNQRKVFLDPSAVRAVMVRDPLARFASVFLNKCFGKNCKNRLCHAQKKKGTPISFKTATKWMLARNPWNAGNDKHWTLQAGHCDLKHQLGEYTIVGLMTKTSLHEDARCILELANISHANQDKEGNPIFSPGRQSSTAEEDMLKRMFTRKAARALMAHLRVDYHHFHLPEPAWISKATGELYSKVAPNCDPTFYREFRNNEGPSLTEGLAEVHGNSTTNKFHNNNTSTLTEGLGEVHGNFSMDKLYNDEASVVLEDVAVVHVNLTTINVGSATITTGIQRLFLAVVGSSIPVVMVLWRVAWRRRCSSWREGTQNSSPPTI